MAERIRAIMIVEIVGRPAEYVKESLKSHVEQMKDKVKDVDVIDIDINEPKKIEEAKEELYTCFAEVEFECLGFLRLIEIIFDFMPSSVEIIEPSELKMNVSDATSFLNILSGRLHRYDEIAKIAQLQNQQLVAKLQQMQKQSQGQRNILSISYADKDKKKDKKMKKEKQKKTKKKSNNKKSKKKK